MKVYYCSICVLVTMLSCISCIGQEGTIPITGHLYITKSTKLQKAFYTRASTASPDTAAIIIEGNDITVDFNGAVLAGSKNTTRPDSFKGIAVFIKAGKNITLKNAVVKGFKVAVMGTKISNLTIDHCDFSYNFRQHLNSNREKEDLTDWQSYHHNENNEWLRFGAGVYLRDCDSAIIRNTRITNGQCGLMLTECNGCLVYNNNFSFNSGIGIGMYRSSYNRILNNMVDWNVRGFSYGVYYRGQDSGGILVYEQSSNNVFAHNSVTHSGDGFFLWAGQTTIDKGTGGCNENLVYGNNFSYAPTNGIEITFSRNRIINNIIKDCWHGIWGGFSYNTVIAANQFSGNLSAISIEHGQDNTIIGNTFEGDQKGIELWYTPNRRGEEGYTGSRDTRSRNYRIGNNTFTGVKTAFDFKKTEAVSLYNNTIMDEILHKSGTNIKTRAGTNAFPDLKRDDSSYIASILPRDTLINAMLPEQHLQGKKYIMMTEWGPYNFRYPILWLTRSDSTGKLHFEIIGNKGSWRIRKMQGVSSPSGMSGSIPAQLSFQKNTGQIKDIHIELEYRGSAVESPFGEIYPAGSRYTFAYSDFELPARWKVKWFAFDSASDPLKQPASFKNLVNGQPVKTADTTALAYAWWSGLGKGYPAANFATVATTTINAPRGNYQVGISAGEMVRVFIDNKLLIDAWDPSKKTVDADFHNDASIVLHGRHAIRIEHAQYGGYGMLVFTLKKQH